jgi:hypothetical protein
MADRSFLNAIAEEIRSARARLSSLLAFYRDQGGDDIGDSDAPAKQSGRPAGGRRRGRPRKTAAGRKGRTKPVNGKKADGTWDLRTKAGRDGAAREKGGGGKKRAAKKKGAAAAAPAGNA